MLTLLACSSTPKITAKQATEKEGRQWLAKFCAVPHPDRELSGGLVMKANTLEFKGQYPASIHFEKTGDFGLEVTNIIGGTLVRLKGDQKALSIEVPTKPKFNRKDVTHYLGLEMGILAQLLYGDLPCPLPEKRKELSVQGPSMVIETEQWRWVYDHASAEQNEVPVRLRLFPTGADSTGKVQIEMNIESWDYPESYARKVSVKSPEGELKWTWRSREFK